MNIAWWKLATFVLTMAALSWGIFPSTRDVASLYVQSGQLQKAQRALDVVLNAGRPDFATTMLAADIALRKGDVHAALGHMEQAHKLRPKNIPMLERLAQLREWTRNPRGAAAIREEILHIQPERTDLLRQLAEAYAYFGQADMESLAISRLVLRDTLPHLPDQVSVQPGTLGADLRNTVRILAHKRMSEGSDQFLSAALIGLHKQVEQPLDLGSPTSEATRLQQAALLLLSYGYYDEAVQLAYIRDVHTGNGTTNRRLLAESMGWAGLAEAMPEVFALLMAQDTSNILLMQDLMGVAQGLNATEALRTVALHLEQKSPERRDVQMLLATIDLQGGDLDRAMKLLTRAGIPGDIRRFEATRLMETAIALPDRALRERMLACTEAIPHGNDIAYLRSRSRLFTSVDRQADALPLYITLVQLPEPTEEDVTALLLAATASKMASASELAEELARTRFTSSLSVTRALAALYVSTGRPQLGLPILRQLVAQSPTEDDTEMLLGVIAQVADARLAIELAPALVAKYPESPRVLMAAATALSSSGQYNAAYPLAARAARAGEGNPEYLSLLLQIAAATGQSSRFQQALQLVAKLDHTASATAMVALRALHPAASTEALQTLQRAASGPARALLQTWAAIADAGGTTEDAFRLYAALYRARSTDTASRDAFIRLAGWTGRPGEAAPVIAAMADASPESHSLAFAAASAWLEVGNAPQALPYTRNALRLQPDHIGTLRNSALALSGTGNYAEAIVPMERLLARNALSNDEKVMLAETYVSVGRPEEALPLLTPLLGHATLPRSPGLTLARALVIAGKMQEAAQVRRRLAAEGPGDARLMRTLGAEAYFAGDNVQASTVFDRLTAQAPDDHLALKGAAISASALQDHQKAVRLFERYLRLVPDDTDARYRLAEELNLQGKGELAARHYKTASRALKAMPARTGYTTSPTVSGKGALPHATGSSARPVSVGDQP